MVALALGLAACDGEPCDGLAVARGLAGPASRDCGSSAPYLDRFDPRTREHSVDCMIDAVLAGQPFHAWWLRECQLDVCTWWGRASDGTTLWTLTQDVLESAPATTGGVHVVACVPVVDERVVDAPGGPVLRRELACGVVFGEAEVGTGSCATVPWPPSDV